MSKGWDQAAVDRAKERMRAAADTLGSIAGIATMHGNAKDAPAHVLAKASLTPRKSTMNKSERSYDQYLDALYKQGRIAYHKFEAVTLKLGDDCRFSPDFLVIGPAGEVEFHDVKARWKSTGKVRIEDDARVKLSVAASTCFPFFTFKTVWMENGTWHSKTY